MKTTILNPKYVYVQASTPSDTTEGKLWYKTGDNTLYASDGSSYNQVTTDLGDLELQQLEQNLQILINSAAASSTLNDYDDMYVDAFSDADGTNDTIDTGNTTAVHGGEYYTNSAGWTTEANYTQTKS